MKRKIMMIIAICVVVVFGVAALVAVVAAIGDPIVNRNNLETMLNCDAANAESRLEPELCEGNYCFTTDGDFRIMQLTDIHICGGLGSYKRDLKAMNAVAAMVAAEKPDLVVVTGDISYGVPFSLNFNNMTVIQNFAELMEHLGVYWTVALGNHDSEWYNTANREKVADYLESDGLSYCLFTRGSKDVYGEGNQFITVKNSLGLYTQAVVVFDSGDYQSGRKYDYIRESQIGWYENGIKALNAANAARLFALDEATLPYPSETYGTVKSLAFFHIPLEEYRYAIAQYTENGDKSTSEVTYIYGEVNEPVCNSPTESALFEKMVELGSTKGVFVGHDHTNNICLEYKGIRLAYSYSVDYYAYKKIDEKGNYRGNTMITASPDCSFTSKLENYYQDKYVSYLPKETVYFE